MNKFIKLKINLLFWACICLIIYIFDLTEKMDDILHGSYSLIDLIITPFFLIIGAPIVNFYLFYFLLAPKFLYRKRVALFIIFALTSSIIISFLYREIRLGNGGINTLIGYSIFTLIFGLFGTLAKKTVIWQKSIEKSRVLHTKLLENKTALLILQAQLNPHFLFNSLNNIDVLIKETPDTASEYLKKLSDILRYVLYETKESETELSKEIEQIKSYIELQKIRTDNAHYVNFNIKGELKDQKIAPMIFIPFIENAFKHCKNKTIENAIDIEFELEKEKVKMICKNYYEENQLEIIKSEGLGIETIKQRLNLLYPKNHELMIDKTGNWFNVSLSIDLKDVN
jgi:two-component system, LytTR family, sensor kinase